MQKSNLYLTMVTAVELFSNAGLTCLKDEFFTSLYMTGGVDYSLKSNGIKPIAKDTNKNCELYSMQDAADVIDIYGPLYLQYLKQRYDHVNDVVVDRARQCDDLVTTLHEWGSRTG